MPADPAPVSVLDSDPQRAGGGAPLRSSHRVLCTAELTFVQLAVCYVQHARPFRS